jgi:hypothetical protein
MYIYFEKAPIQGADLMPKGYQQQVPALNKEKDCARKARAVLHG